MKKAYEKKTIIYDFKTQDEALKWLTLKVKEIESQKEHYVINQSVYNNNSVYAEYSWSAEITYHIDYVALRK